MSALDRPMIQHSNVSCHPPMHVQGPSQHELRQNNDMEAYFSKNCSIHESKEGEKKRKNVIDKLQFIAREWATEVGKVKSLSVDLYKDGGGLQLRVFGSTRLNVHNPESDIDVLCVAPSFITRHDFFNSFVKVLQQRHDVDSLTSIPEAYTPVVKFSIDNQSVDMVFASLSARMNSQTQQTIITIIPPDFNILNVQWLWGLDDPSVRSMNGCRVAEMILKIAPSSTFCSVLRIIKYWARRRGIYSNVLGFLGGVNYAILVAFVCQLFPNSCPYTLVRKFFSVLCAWKWPMPICIAPFEDLQVPDTDGRYLTVWNPRSNHKDSLHLMPIITPAYPAMNSAYNVGPPQFRYINEEIARANLLFQNQLRTTEAAFRWNTLMECSTLDFFSKYPRYIQVNISATTMEDQRNWFGFVESRLRVFVVSLEQPPLVFSHPMANCFHRQPSSYSNGSNSHHSSSTSNYSSNSGGENENSSYVSPAATIPRKSESDIDLLKLNLASATKAEESSSSSTDDDDNKKGTVLAEIRTPDKVRSSSSSSSKSNGQESWSSSFFVGISFQIGATQADITSAVNDFKYRVTGWMLKKPTMEMVISIHDQRTIPSFVYEVKAEPSNVKSCTPKPVRIRPVQSTIGVNSNSSSSSGDCGDHGDDLASRLVCEHLPPPKAVHSSDSVSNGTVAPPPTPSLLNAVKVLFKDESPCQSDLTSGKVNVSELKHLDVKDIFASVAASSSHALISPSSTVSSEKTNQTNQNQQQPLQQQNRKNKNKNNKNQDKLQQAQPTPAVTTTATNDLATHDLMAFPPLGSKTTVTNNSTIGTKNGNIQKNANNNNKSSHNHQTALHKLFHIGSNGSGSENGFVDNGQGGLTSSEDNKRSHHDTADHSKTSWSQDHLNKQHLLHTKQLHQNGNEIGSSPLKKLKKETEK